MFHDLEGESLHHVMCHALRIETVLFYKHLLYTVSNSRFISSVLEVKVAMWDSWHILKLF